MSRGIERERESTRPDERENPALRVPAIRRARDRSPHARDPTAGGRDGMETSCKAQLVPPVPPAVVHGGLAPGAARSAPACNRPGIRERFRGLARDLSEGKGKEQPGSPDQSSAKHHMAWPVVVEHTHRPLGLARDVGKSSRCPEDDCSPRGLARGEDREAVTARQCPAESPLRQQLVTKGTCGLAHVAGCAAGKQGCPMPCVDVPPLQATPEGGALQPTTSQSGTMWGDRSDSEEGCEKEAAAEVVVDVAGDGLQRSAEAWGSFDMCRRDTCGCRNEYGGMRSQRVKSEATGIPPTC